MCVVAEAGSGEELLKKAAFTEADVIITDICMPEMTNGLETLRLLAEKFPHLPCIALSFSDNPLYIRQVMEAGAKAYCVKPGEPKQLIEAIRQVLKGDTFYCSDTWPIISRYEREIQARGKDETSLTRKEKEILQLFCEEHTAKAIAARLGSTPQTIESYSKLIKEKTGTKSVAGMVVYSIRNFIYLLKR